MVLGDVLDRQHDASVVKLRAKDRPGHFEVLEQHRLWSAEVLAPFPQLQRFATAMGALPRLAEWRRSGGASAALGLESER